MAANTSIPAFVPAASETLRLTPRAELKQQAAYTGTAKTGLAKAAAAQAELDRRKHNRARKAAIQLAQA